MATFNRKNLLAFGGYALFFLVCFMTFAYLTFPYDRIRHVFEAQVAGSGRPGEPQTRLSIGDLGPHWLSGVALRTVSLEQANDTGEPATRIALDRLTLRAKPLSLLFGGVDVAFGAEIGDGEIDGIYETEDGRVSRVEAELDQVDLGKLGIGGYLGVPLRGLATGLLDVALPKEPNGTQGAVELRIEKLKLGDGKSKVKVPGMAGGLTIDPIDAGTLELTVAVRDGVATIEKMEAKGKDIELSGSGSIRIAQVFAASRADITLAVKFADAYKTKSDKTKIMFELLEQNPMIKRAIGSDGMMRLKLTGALNALQTAPGGAPARSPARETKRKAAKN
jgi:type II secretion system protein N